MVSEVQMLSSRSSGNAIVKYGCHHQFWTPIPPRSPPRRHLSRGGGYILKPPAADFLAHPPPLYAPPHTLEGCFQGWRVGVKNTWPAKIHLLDFSLGTSENLQKFDLLKISSPVGKGLQNPQFSKSSAPSESRFSTFLGSPDNPYPLN